MPEFAMSVSADHTTDNLPPGIRCISGVLVLVLGYFLIEQTRASL